MDHSYIDENNLIDRYVRGTLPVTERTAFDEHFVDCPQCLEHLGIARSMREAIRVAAADMAVEAQTAPASGGWLGGVLGWRWAVAGAATCFVVASLTGIVLFRQLERTRNELGVSQLAFAREVENARTAALSPNQNPPLVYVLNQSRGAGETARTIEIPRSPQWMVFSIEADVSQFQNYRALLQNQTGQAIWQKENLQPSSPDTIAIPLLSTVLAPGAYTLRLEALDATGRYLPMASFSVQAKESH